MLREAYSRLRACAVDEFDASKVKKVIVDPTEVTEPMGLNRVESACAGLRKMYLPRTWDDRCAFCSARHSIVEKGTCKFWIKWVEDAKAREAAEAAAKAEAAPAEAAPKTAAKAEAPKAEARPPKAEVVKAVKHKAAEVAEEEVPFVPFMPKLRQKEADEVTEDKENGSPETVDVA